MKQQLRRWCLLFVLAASPAYAQFPQTLSLESTSPAIVSSAVTRAGWQYTVTVTGTYSMWPPYRARGVDAAYVYDVPAEEVQAFRWPPSFLYAIPHWVGDTLEVPPFRFPGQQFKFRTRDNIGFRINGQPLANRGLTTSHRYQATVVGDGRPIEFQILDSAFNIRDNRIIPRYEDNSGALSILIEERPHFNVCGVQTFCQDGEMRLAIAASLLEYDSAGRAENVLKQPSQMTVVVDGKTIDADSISCGSRAPVAYTLVLDRSGSMKFPYDGGTDRITALKRAAHGFLRTLKPNDQVMLITFSFDDQITVDVPWTSDTSRLGQGIDAIDPVGGTAWRDAAWIGLDHASRHYNPIKAVVLLTDGDDTHSRRTLATVIAKARTVNVPVFTIGMALVDSSEQPLRYLASESNGRFFQARDQRAIDSAFSNLSRAVASNECCTVYVTLPRSVTEHAGVKQIDVYARADGGAVASRAYQVYVSDSCRRVSAVTADRVRNSAMLISPNPVASSGMLQLNLERAGVVIVEMISSDGLMHRILQPATMSSGRHSVRLDYVGLASGIYTVRLLVDGRENARERVIIVH